MARAGSPAGTRNVPANRLAEPGTGRRSVSEHVSDQSLSHPSSLISDPISVTRSGRGVWSAMAGPIVNADIEATTVAASREHCSELRI